MLVVMQTGAPEEQVKAVCERIEALGFEAHPIFGAFKTVIGVTGDTRRLDVGSLEALAGVAECIIIGKPYKLVSREFKKEDTVLRIKTPSGEVAFGGGAVGMIAGPCAVETREQVFAIAEPLSKAGVKLFRGGAYKPRTSPYSFQGLAVPGLELLTEIRDKFGMGIVTEAVDNEGVDHVERYADVIQIGARNMQNYSLLKRAGRAKIPVMLKRGLSATLDELLMAAEYIASEGNQQIMLCERGVRTFADHSRNTLDLSIVPAAKALSHLPIICDPSHGTGQRRKVLPLSRAAIAVGADGLMIEVHNQPDRALSDGVQSMLPQDFAELREECAAIAAVMHRTLN
jgi:3-deoxy-7-phosphoheptulonate synthase